MKRKKKRKRRKRSSRRSATPANQTENKPGKDHGLAADMLLTDLVDRQIHDELCNLVYEEVEEQEEDILIWDPTQLPEEETKWFLKQWAHVNGNKTGDRRSSHAIETIPDIEEALQSLAMHGYQINATLDKLKYDRNLHDHTDNAAGSARTEQGESQSKMTDRMKMKFERGLVKFGENMDRIHSHYSCLQSTTPLDLDLYMYSDERQRFISSVEVSKKIVTRLDSASYQHMSQIEFFEVDKDWAKMRQVVLAAENANTASQTRGQSSRCLRQRRLRRPPRRFVNYRFL